MDRFVIQVKITTETFTKVRYYSGAETNKLVDDFENSYIYLGTDELKQDLEVINNSYAIQAMMNSKFSNVEVLVLTESVGENRHRVWVDIQIKNIVDSLDDI